MPVLQGKKIKTFIIPLEIFDGPSGMVGQISIQVAFICPDWTLIFIDHNVMITFYIMALHHPISKADLEPSSRVSHSNLKFKINQCSVIDLATALELQAWPCLFKRAS
jgi:hypothetical protein